MLTSVFVCYPVYFILLVSSSFREKGGAYSVGAKSSAGVFSFFSYRYDFELKLIWSATSNCVSRDPNSVEIFKSFENCIDWAIDGNFSYQDVGEAKLGVFSQVCVLTLLFF